MKYILLIGLLLLTLCACGKTGDVKVLEMESGQYTVQIKDWKEDWAWVGNDGYTNTDIVYVQRRCGGLLIFNNEDAACDYKEKIENLTSIKRIVKCKPQEVE